jgi:hypothetical protein
MDFFLDTGPIYGLSNPLSSHHNQCNNHFIKYKFEDHNYFAVKQLIQTEVQNIHRKRTSEEQDIETRDIEKKIARILKLINDFNYDNNQQSFKTLFSELYHFFEINKTDDNIKERDSKILSNAFLWDHSNPALNRPRFLTVDESDISDNRSKLKMIANSCLNYETKIGIYTIKEMVELGL